MVQVLQHSKHEHMLITVLISHLKTLNSTKLFSIRRIQFSVNGKKQRETEGRIHRSFVTVGGRRICFIGTDHIYTESRNYPIQGAAADLQMIAIQRVYSALKATDQPAHLINFVHDELVLEVKDDVIDTVSKLVRREMTQAFLGIIQRLSSG